MAVGKIKEFDTESGNWTLYCGRVEMYFRANAINEELKLPTLISLVGDSVYELMVNLCNPKKPTDLTYDELVTIVREHLQPKPSVMAERYRFRQRRQETGENLMQYIAALKKLSKDCEFKETLTDNLRDQFVCGVSSDLIRQRLFSECNLTYAKALRLATSLEAAERDAAAVDLTAPNCGSDGTSAMHALRATTTAAAAGRGRGGSGGGSGGGGRFHKAQGMAAVASSPAQGRGCAACGGQHHSDGCRYKNFVCNSCRNTGHLKRVCPYKDTSAKSSGGRRYTKRGGDGGQREAGAHYVRPATGPSESSSDDGGVEEPLFQLTLGDYKPVSLDVTVNGRVLTMEVDTGSPGSCISKETYETYFRNISLERSKYVFMFYDGKSKVRPLGVMKAKVRYKSCEKILEMFVIDKAVTTLIGRQWLAELGIQIPVLQNPKVNNNFKMEPVTDVIRDMLDRHKAVWSGGLGRYTGGCATLRVREGAAPVFHRARPVPYALRERVDAEIDAMLRDGIIEPVDCSDWATPLVLVNKSDGGLRLCADFKVTLNPALLVDRYPLPKVDDLLANLAGGEEFTKIDLSQAYNQICLSDDSKKYCVINTHRGLFKYNRLVYGLSSSSGIFQRIVSNLVGNIPNVQCFADDIILTHKDRASHIKALEALLCRLESAGMKVKLEKCSFLAKEVKYLGYIVDKNGIRPDPEKLRAIKDMPSPTEISELRSFLGMVNFYAKFVPKLSGILHPLHELLHRGSRWQWGARHQQAFERVKHMLMGRRVLAHYDPACELVLTCDASALGVGGVLSQISRGGGGEERAVSYVSRKLTKAEQGYAQIHREALAIVYCVKKFHQYLIGRKFKLKTDHKPLVSIFGSQKGIPTMAASRMQRWALILSAYDFSIEYVGTHSNGADILSRLPVQEKCVEEPPEQTYLHFATNAMLLDGEVIRRETSRDPILSRVYGYIENGWPQAVDIKQLDPYFTRRTELYIELGCVMWGHRLVIPESCRRSVLSELHEPHMGIVKTKAYARSYVWWPGLDEAVEMTCRTCVTCAAVAAAPPGAPPSPWRWPHSPYERIHLDFLGPIDKQMYLISVDARSKWIEVFKMTRTTAEATIGKLRESWSRWGIPKQVVSDNGPPFTSGQFKTFLDRNAIHQLFSAPYHPASNGAAENAVKIVKNVIKKARREGIDPELAIQRYLLVYHNTPHCATGASPAQLLQGRHLRTRLDIIKPDPGRKLRDREFEAVEHAKGARQLNPGETVWYRNFGSNNKWVPGQITDRHGANNYSVKSSDGTAAAHRHIDQLRRRSTCIFPSESNTNTGSGEQTAVSELPTSVPKPFISVEAMEQGSNRASSSIDPCSKQVEASMHPTPPVIDADVLTPSKRTRKPVKRYGLEID